MIRTKYTLLLLVVMIYLLLVGSYCAYGSRNLLTNGGFDAGTSDPWDIYGEAEVEIAQDGAGYYLHIITRKSENSWDDGMAHRGHIFEKGKVYTLAAFIRSPDKLRINFKLERSVYPWTTYREQSFTATQEWKEYHITTGTMVSDVRPAAIAFHFAYDVGELHVDGVTFYEGEYRPRDPDQRAYVPPGPGENHLTNASFESSILGPWRIYGAVTEEVVPRDATEGEYCLRIITAKGESPYSAGLNQGGHIFEKGKRYTLSAFLKSPDSLRINLKLESAREPWAAYAEESFTTTREWKEYRITTGVMAGDVRPAAVALHFAYDVGELYIDNVKLYEGAPPIAAFSASPMSGTAPLTVSFRDRSQNDPTYWWWDFGDGGTSDLQNPTHTYTEPGYYTVSLVVTNLNGSDTETKEGYIHVTQEVSITLLAPNGGEKIGGGNIYDIRWNTTGSDIHHIHLLYSIDNGNYQDITTNTQDDGDYQWLTPYIDKSTVRVKVMAEGHDNSIRAQDESDREFIIDSTPPMTSVSLRGREGKNGWYISGVEVELTATDNLSDISKTEYRLGESEEWRTYPMGGLTIEHSASIGYRSWDKADNEEPEKIQTVKIDKTSPSITGWIQEPPDLKAAHQGTFRVMVKLTDEDGSGIEDAPELRYHIGDDTDYGSYESMIPDADELWYFGIAVRDWGQNAGKWIYYEIQASDVAGNHMSMEKSEFIDPPPVISILRPNHGQEYPSATTSVTLEVEIENHAGHWHWKLNEPFPNSGPAGGNRVELGNTATIAGLQDGQNYIVYVTLMNSDGSMLTPSVTASAEFSIAPSSDFAISCFKTEVEASVGERAIYVLDIAGENDFTDKVKLLYDVPTELTDETKPLPGDAEVIFQPEEVALSKEEPSHTCQLTVMLPVDIVPGHYRFTVFGIASSIAPKKLELTLVVKRITTYITLVASPSDVHRLQPLELSGQLGLRSDAQVELDGLSVRITLSTPSGSLHRREPTTGIDQTYQLSEPFIPDEVGEWSIVAEFGGNEILEPSISPKIPMFVERTPAEIIFLNDVGEEITSAGGRLGSNFIITGQLRPLYGELTLREKLIRLRMRRPNDAEATIPEVTTETLGKFHYELILDDAGDWEINANWPGDDEYESAEGKLAIHVPDELGKAIVVLGGGDQYDSPAWETFRRVAEYVYQIFLRRSLRPEDVYILSPDPDAMLLAPESHVSRTSISALDFAITDWAASEVNSKIPLYIYLVSHNLDDQFLLEKHGQQEEYVGPIQLDKWLDKLPEGTQVVIIIEACYSGRFIRTQDGKPTALGSSGRVIVTSARGDRQARLLPSRSSFSKFLFDRINANYTIAEAFQYAENIMERIPSHSNQFPQIDANGDARVNTPQDYEGINFCIGATIEVIPPKIVYITPAQTILGDGPLADVSHEISVEVQGIGVERVYATVVPPDFRPKERISDWSALNFPEFDLKMVAEREQNRYEYTATYSGFEVCGDYTFIVNAENPDGSAEPVKTIVSVELKVMPWDVDGNGMVDISDLMLVGSAFGTSGSETSLDVNADGTVNMLDIVIVAMHYGETIYLCSPSIPASPHTLRMSEVEQWLRLAKADDDGSEMFRRGIAVLEYLLNSIVPSETGLLQNYPNPFNPETWIPYKLSEASEVSITIYEVTGKLVRHLDLGHKPAGIYQTQDTAAHWDGRNNAGECAASGVYFAVLRAGENQQTRRMVLVK